MSERASIFRELTPSKCDNILDTLNGCAAHVSRKLLVAENGKALFQAELEPIAAGNAVTRPIMEIFMGDNAFNTFEIHIGRAFTVSE